MQQVLLFRWGSGESEGCFVTGAGTGGGEGGGKLVITQQKARVAKVPSSATTLAGTARGLVPTRVAPGGHVPAPPAYPSPPSSKNQRTNFFQGMDGCWNYEKSRL